jgi:GNAT superfamily N-acetyltransferase
MTYTITEAREAENAFAPILAPLLAFNEDQVGDAMGRAFALTVAGPDGATQGGLFARSNWGSFYVALLVVPEALRGQGIGCELMDRAEAEARRQGCWNIWLDTFAFQARGFYEKLGFEVFGQFDGPHPAFPRYFMQKRL